ncbi:mannose-1-phosphate guanylyltransferase [Christiangramia echinicola]|uniref:mannose-1-phosphate guanylyltransferase n=1 Tax=Christiangramia echinicola TaxID=279359 RepID=UPI00042A7095|nr:mannose-1-phosphate guanylyltransferase [Christiangramia echinicola]
MRNNNYAVIMAGGVGSRFWPVSKETNPKQFQDILGSGKTLIQTTFDRLAKFIPAENIYILTNSIYQEIVLKQLPKISLDQIVMEPVMRNTAPCILLAAMKIYKKDPNATMLVAPSDHWIQQEDLYQNDMELAFAQAELTSNLITFGIRPNFPNTGYGYIQYENSAKELIFHVSRFTEKPDFQTAQNFIEQGNYLWNSGIFVWTAEAILQEFKVHLPEMHQLFEKGHHSYNNIAETDFLKSHYHLAENISIDYGIIEKAKNVKVVPASFCWNDLGTWCSLQDELPADNELNTVVNSRLIAMDATHNIVRTESDKVVLIEGLSDYMILENSEVLLIVPKRKEQQIKEVRQMVIDKYGRHFA